MKQETQVHIDKSLKHLESDFSKLQLGRANPALIEDIYVEQYGTLQPIKNCASINILDPQTLSIVPWDKSIVHAIAKAITEAWVWLNPQTMWDSVMIKIPPLTEERRKEIIKVVKNFSEKAKISIRNIRTDALKAIKKQEAEKTISQDMAKDMETELQKQINEANTYIDTLSKKKESDIMNI